jgi:hypothetical protein
MTWEHLKRVGKFSVGCGTAKAVLKEIALLAKPNGECVVSIADLVRRLEFSEKTIRRAIAKLVADGHLKKERRTGARGFRTADLYCICGASNDHPPTGQNDQLAYRSKRPLGLPVKLTGPLTEELSTRVVKPISSTLEEDRWNGSVWCCPAGDGLTSDELAAMDGEVPA